MYRRTIRPPSLGSRALILLVRGYGRLLSPVFPTACRFAPSCSEFAHHALAQHGVLRGLGLIFARLARCHPWHPGGYDPVPSLRP